MVWSSPYISHLTCGPLKLPRHHILVWESHPSPPSGSWCPDQLHPLQGRFKPVKLPSHTAFIFKEAIQDQKKKAYVSLLDVQKPLIRYWIMDCSVTYTSMESKIILLRKWYDSSTSTVLWDGEQSCPFNINQGRSETRSHPVPSVLQPACLSMNY